MDMEQTLTEQITVRIQEYLADPDHDALNLRQLVSQFNALPLCVDWERCWAVRPDGQVVVFSHENEDPGLREEDNRRMVNAVLFQGSLTYPEIKSLVPARPADAGDCPFCTAKDIDPEVFKNETIICYCGGLGWVPAEA